MVEAQNIFDDLVAPSCPSELDSPRLHELLDNTDVRNLTWGGKGVGSQGDGTAQFICRGKEERDELSKVLEAGRNVNCYYLTLNPKK